MYFKIVELDLKQPFGDLTGSKLIKEIKLQSRDLFKQNLLINEKIYHPCVGYGGVLGVTEMKLNRSQENHVICEEGLKCPYCEYVDDEAYLLKEHKGHKECVYCHSKIKYVIDTEANTSGECLQEIYRTEPVKLKEPIKL
ncbi:hypothetical protein [Bacillus sp. NPDC094106]|uniref:hypothetical protein n=1 Tax=Bacillus sp. NPDC094106 TaxID=3363949 RepID=UPI00381140F3